MNRLISFLAFPLLLLSCSGPGIVDLRVEWCDSPICVDTRTPRFTWTFDSGHNPDFVQKSFEITLSCSDGSPVWTSGRVESGDMCYMSPTDMPLRPMTGYNWRVSATGENGEHLSSEDVRFETALFGPDDWNASWISDGRLEDEETAPVLKRDFTAAEGFTKARLCISAAAYADFYINGTPVFPSPLNPAYTDYGKRSLYVVKDVTDMLHPGDNELFAVLGNGFYNVVDYVAVWDFDKALWRGRARMIAQLHVEYPDGRKYVIGTDSSWKALTVPSANPFRMNNIYSGDTYDCRIPSPGPMAETDSRLWSAAVTVPAPSGKLRAQYMAENAVAEKVSARSVKSFGDTVFVCDFGANMSGLSEFVVGGDEGTVVKVRHGECLDSAGRLTVKHMDEHFRPRAGHEFQTDVYILGEGSNVIGDRFSYDGFRYAELCSDRPVNLKAAGASFIHTGLRRTGHVSTTDTLLLGIHEMVIRSYLSNCMGIPTDCPQREKNGWTADGYVSCEIGLLNFDSADFYLKWIDDLVDNQMPDGQICGIVPSHGWGLGIGPVWDAVLFVVPEKLYDYTGDIRGIERAAQACRSYLGFLSTKEAPDGSVEYGLGDWVAYSTQTPNDYTSTCYYWYELETMARFERLLGGDAARWQTGADRIRELINTKWLDRKTGVYANGSQTAQSLALYLGFVPEDMSDKVAGKLVEAVHAASDRLDCGMIGSKTVLRMLTEYGYADLAYTMATSPEAPSWGWWRRHGYTTMPEQWVVREGVGLSMNHVFLGDVDAWMYNCIAGISPDPQCPGFRHIILRPNFISGLDGFSASCGTASGKVSSSWKRCGGKVFLEVSLPANTGSTLYAAGEVYEIGGGRHCFTFDN